MAKAEYRVYFDSAPATAEQLARFTEIRIDQGIGVAAEAELDFPIGTSDAGIWSGIEEDFAQPFSRLRIEVKVADGDFVPLIDGPDTPSFPSSHSLQAHLISGALKLALPAPSSTPPPAVSYTAQALDVLADRVARNREIAGVHYHMDSMAGVVGAAACIAKLSALPATSLFQTLVRNAATELQNLP